MASQICPQCKHEAAGTARYCPNCAAPLAADAAAPPSQITSRTPTRLDMAANRSRRILVMVLGIAVVVLLALVGFFWHQSSVLQAEHMGLAAAPLVGAPPVALPAAEPVVGAKAAPGVAVPAEVTDYLNFLGKIEDQRVTLKNNLAQGISMLGAAKSLQSADEPQQQQSASSQINTGYSNYTQQWQDLIKSFQDKQPPAECESLANNYYRLLQDYSAYISQIQVAMQNRDINKLTSLQSGAQSQVNIDVANADDALTLICQKYGMVKPFNIESDAAGAGTPVVGP